MEFELTSRNKESLFDQNQSSKEKYIGEIQQNYPRHKYISYLLALCTFIQLFISACLLFISSESIYLEFAVDTLSVISTLLVTQWLEGRSKLNENIRLLDTNQIKDRVDTSIIYGLSLFQSIWLSVDLFGIAMEWTEFRSDIIAILEGLNFSSGATDEIFDLTAFIFLGTKLTTLILYLYFLRLSFRALKARSEFANFFGIHGIIFIISGLSMLVGVTTILFCFKYPYLSDIVPESWISVQFVLAMIIVVLGYTMAEKTSISKKDVKMLMFFSAALLFIVIFVTKMDYEYSENVEKYYGSIDDKVDFKYLAGLINEKDFMYSSCKEKYAAPQHACEDSEKVLSWEDGTASQKMRCLNMGCKEVLGELYSKGFYSLSNSALFLAFCLAGTFLTMLNAYSSREKNEYKPESKAQDIFMAFGLIAAFVFTAASLSDTKLFVKTYSKEVQQAYISNFLGSHESFNDMYRDFKLSQVDPEVFYNFLTEENKYVIHEIDLQNSDGFDMKINKIGNRSSTFKEFTSDLINTNSGIGLGIINLYVEKIRGIFLVTYVTPNKSQKLFEAIKQSTKSATDFPQTKNFTLIAAENNLGIMFTSEENSVNLDFILQSFKTQFDRIPKKFNFESVSPPVPYKHSKDYLYQLPVFDLTDIFDPEVAIMVNELNSNADTEDTKAIQIYLRDGHAVGKKISSYLLSDLRRDLIIYLQFEYETVKRPVAVLLPYHLPFRTNYIKDFVDQCAKNAVSVVELEDSDDFEISTLIEVGAVSSPEERTKIATNYLNNLK